MAKGFADLHNHQFAYLGFGGMAFHGRAFGDMADALPWCDYARFGGIPIPNNPIHGPGGILDVVGQVMANSYGHGGLGIGHKVGGYPQFDGWPRWDSVTHQAVYEDWLRRAVDGGLRLMVMLAVNSEYMCGLVNGTLSCNDMQAVDRQLDAAKEMEAYIDQKSGGAGQGWYRIVYTPEQARDVIASGNLAVVLGIEVDHLFNCHNESDLNEEQLRQELDRYYNKGVRHVFPIHFGNNGYGGTAFQNNLQYGRMQEHPAHPWNIPLQVSPLNPFPTAPLAYTVETEDAKKFGYEYRTGRRNILGLTNLGKTLIHEMIKRGMIIDVDHMSARARADTLDICEKANYPVVSGHTGFVDLCRGSKRHEGQLLAGEAERIRHLGGMISVIVKQGNIDEIITWEGPGQPVIPHTSGNTSNTLVQAYLYAVAKMHAGPVGLGTDFNGFAGLPGPRFGPEASPGGHHGPKPDNRLPPRFRAAASGVELDWSKAGKKSFNFNEDGLAHVGMLPDLIADFQQMGVTGSHLEPLLNSADGYATVWSKAHRRSRHIDELIPAVTLLL